jgi:hypothetical protein
VRDFTRLLFVLMRWRDTKLRESPAPQLPLRETRITLRMGRLSPLRAGYYTQIKSRK